MSDAIMALGQRIIELEMELGEARRNDDIVQFFFSYILSMGGKIKVERKFADSLVATGVAFRFVETDTHIVLEASIMDEPTSRMQ